MKSTSQRFQKSLVTVAMGFRKQSEMNGLYIFKKSQKTKLLQFAINLFNKNKTLLVLKVRQQGFKSEHINIDTQQALEDFILNVDTIFEKDNEIWIIESSTILSWKCRLYVSNTTNASDLIEMAFSYDDHILDHLGKNNNEQIPYITLKKSYENIEIEKSNLTDAQLQEIQNIVKRLYKNKGSVINQIKKDMEFIPLDNISFDFRFENNKFDFHDFDVPPQSVQKVIDFYIPAYLNRIKRKKIKVNL